MRLRDRVQIIVEAGYRGASVGAFQWDVSSWDSGNTWQGVEPTFIALDGWTVTRVQTRRGRDRGHQRHSAGTATVELVYRTPAGAWSFKPNAPVQLGQEMRIRVQPFSLTGDALGAPLGIFRGAVRDVADDWTPAAPDRPGQLRITASLTDRFGDLAAVDLPEQAVAAGLDDTTDARLRRILDLAHIDRYFLKAPAAGVVHHQSSTFARNLLDEAQVAVESETGDFYVDRDGFFAFRQREGVGAHAREDVAQMTWSNTGAAGSVAPGGPFRTRQNLDDVVNQVSMARAGGVAYVAGGPTTDSALRYGLRTYQRFDLTCRYDADVTYAADWRLAQLRARTERIEAVQANVNPNVADARLLDLLDVELRDRHDMRWSDDTGRDMIGWLAVQGISHRIEADSWTVSVNLWAYAGAFVQEAKAWGTAIWGTDVWGA